MKRHYKSKGFNPASLIQPALEAQAKELVGPSAHRKWLPLWLPTLIAFVWGVYVLWVAAPATAEGRLLRFLGILLPLIVLSGIASATAAAWRGRIDRGLGGVLWFLIPSGLMLLLAGAVVTGFRDVPILSSAFGAGFSFEVRLGATLLALAFFNSVINQARSRERAQGIALRKRLASVRRYFQQELDRPQPALRDEWFPYVIAFGLDRDAQDWFKAHGGESAGRSETSILVELALDVVILVRQRSARLAGAEAAARLAEPAPPSAWAVAASSLAAGVAAPSSSGSSSGGGGGGGGGGSSSGGGGGGGW